MRFRQIAQQPQATLRDGKSRSKCAAAGVEADLRDSRSSDGYFLPGPASFLPRLAIGAQLNIKSEDAYRLASRLSELTGESLTSVVTKSLRAELGRQERQRDIDLKVERMLEMGREIRAHMRTPVSSDTSWMYSGNGVPQ